MDHRLAIEDTLTHAIIDRYVQLGAVPTREVCGRRRTRSDRLLERPDFDDAVRDSTWDVRHFFNGGGQVGGFDDSEPSNRQGGRHKWAIKSFPAGRVWVAYLYRRARDS